MTASAADPSPSPTRPDTRPDTGHDTRLGRHFWTVWLGQLVSTVGSTLAGIGVAVYVYVETGSAAWLGVLLALAVAPTVAATPLLRLVDRHDRRHVMIVADSISAIAPAIALAVAVTGRLEVWHLAVVGLVGGLGNAFQVPAYQAAIPDLVPHAAIGRANGLVQLGPAVAIVVGPAVATWMVSVGGIEAILVADLASFVFGVTATVLTRFRSKAVPHTDAGAASRLGGLLPGLTWLRTDGRALLALLGVIAIVNFALAFFNVGLLALATELGGTARAGVVPTLGGVGMIVGSLVLGSRGVPQRRVRMLAVGLGGMGIGALVAAARPSFALLIVGITLAMASVPLLNTVTATLFHEHVPAEVRGQVFGVRAAIGGALNPVGSLLAGITISGVAAPLVAADGAVGDIVGTLVGEGGGRDAALVLAAVGLVLLASAQAVVRNARVVGLDRATDHAGHEAASPPTDAILVGDG